MTLEVVRTQAKDRTLSPSGVNGNAIVEKGPKYKQRSALSDEHSVLVSLHAKRRTNVNLKNAVFWDEMPCGSCKNRRVGGTYRLHHHGEIISELGTALAVTTN
jgi:hypothetical protein